MSDTLHVSSKNRTHAGKTELVIQADCGRLVVYQYEGLPIKERLFINVLEENLRFQEYRIRNVLTNLPPEKLRAHTAATISRYQWACS